MIRFLFKLFLVVALALAAVIYHNTDSGREMERRIGEEIGTEKLLKRSKELFVKLKDSIMLKGMDRDRPREKEEIKEAVKSPEERESQPEKKAEKSDKTRKNAGEKKGKRVEKIEESERKKLEAIIESGG